MTPVAEQPERLEAADRSTERGRRIRVVFCTDNLGIGGTELNAVRTAERLDRSRFDVQVVCLQGDGPLLARYRAAGVPVSRLSMGRLYSLASFREGVRLTRLLARDHVDVFHSHDAYSNVFGTVCARAAGVPAVIASRRWWELRFSRSLRVANRLAYRAAHCVLANSPAVGTSLAADEGVAAAKVCVIPNFVDEAAFAAPSAAEREQLRRQLGLEPDNLVVGIVARLSRVKDHATLIRAAAVLKPRWPELRWLVVGDGELRGELEALAAELGVAAAMRFAGLWPHLPNLHHLCDVSVLCSLREGFPNSVIEAMAAGRPVVATAVGGVPDAVRHGENGFLIPPRKPEELAAAIEMLLFQPDLRRDFGAEGERRARESYGRTATLAALEGLYERLLAR